MLNWLCAGNGGPAHRHGPHGPLAAKPLALPRHAPTAAGLQRARYRSLDSFSPVKCNTRDLY